MVFLPTLSQNSVTFSFPCISQLLEDTQISVNTVHPGYVKTDLFENMKIENGVPDAFEGARVLSMQPRIF